MGKITMENQKKTRIVVATHKKYKMPKDSIYLPLHVGAEGKGALGYAGDNTGEHISMKNPYFCELTGLYWAWKNLDCDYLGMVHYRRYFTGGRKTGISVNEKVHHVLNETEVLDLEKNYDIIVPEKQHYFIETLYSHYGHSHYHEHLDITREIILEKYPEYIETFDRVMKQRSGHMFNMFIMKKELADQYCAWLFDILFELEKRVDTDNLSPFQGRLFGRIGEIIFNVWLLYQKENCGYRVGMVPLLYMEPINWKKKVIAFLKAKFFHKKYDGSF